MSLGALDFGLLVDGGVVMVEAIFHRAQHGGSLQRELAPSTRAMARPVFYSVLIIVLVYVPILTLGGVEGKMFTPMAITVVLALVGALALSLTYVPAMARLVLRPRDVPERAPLLVRLAERAYVPVLRGAQRFPSLVLAGAIALLALGVILFVRSGTAFVPQLDEGDLVIQTTRAPDIHIEAAVQDALRLERALRAVPEVVHVSSRIGSPAVATDIMGLEQADVFVKLKPRGEWRAGLTQEGLIAEVERRIDGGDPSFTQPIQMRFNELLGGSVSDVTLSIYGEDLGELRRLAERARAAIAPVEGSADVRIYSPPGVPMLEVRPDPLAAATHGFSAADVLAHVQALRVGVPAGVTYDGPVRIGVRVRMSGAPDAFALGDTPVPTAEGSLVTLSRVAHVERVDTSSLVSRDEAQRRIVVGFNVRGRDLGSVVEDAQAAVSRALQAPAGYRLDWGGQYENLEQAKARLAIVIPVVMALILAILLWLFRSIRPALIIFLNVPFAVVGGVVALAVRDLPVSISAAVGFIALSGIAVLNGVVLMSRLRQAEAEGLSPAEAAYDAATSRLRPVLMTALVAALGFVPMMLARGVGAEVQRPLATVVVGGLVTSTLLTLVILPALYAWLPRRAPKRVDPPDAP
jgi:cobalt-zinc-cadmium resistance protein CzcA